MHVSTQASKGGATSYSLGHSPSELKRLEDQGTVYRSFTEKVFRSAGLAEGMRVLDVGCGAGDVCMAAATCVGTTGEVVGIDRSEEAIASTRARLAALGIANVQLRCEDLLAVSDPKPFDAVVGRFILLHVADSASALRTLSRQLVPGGRMAFIEMDLTTAEAIPPFDAFTKTLGWVVEAYRRDGVEVDMASRLHATFRKAGLVPHMVGMMQADGGLDSFAYRYTAETTRSLISRIVATGVATKDEVDIDNLEDRLRAAGGGDEQCFFYPRMVGAWSQLDDDPGRLPEDLRHT